MERRQPNRDVPLHVEMQEYIDAVRMYLLSHGYRVSPAPTGRIRCPSCREEITAYDDHATGCPEWGANPEDLL